MGDRVNDHSHGHGHSHGHHHGHHHHHHGHAHGHGHNHAPTGFGRAFALGIGFNLAFVIVEAVYGFLANSVALLADAGHNLSDVLGLVIAWVAYALSRRAPSTRFTYGLRSSSILAALFNALFLILACGGITLEAIQRFGAPAEVQGRTVIFVAALGIAINLGTALLFARGRRGDINIRGAFLHMAADALVSAGVVLAGLATLWTGAKWIDPATSLAIVAVILLGTWGLFRESLAMSLQGVPPGIDPAQVTAHLGTLPGVVDVHHVHIWPMSTTETALTAHLLMPAGFPGDRFLEEAAHGLETRFRISHATLQVETGQDCPVGDC
ncbi:cation transporter [Sphingomonas oleivorans]|uniref:Cation transporter n=1 Tax=Sphingomonas oleivorans TaxID=1735121 RepID=A0A2T5FVU0_9SPHN|nr:cation diffusion facilitator family transporter [Sphingomonas oleivorans]PTQ09890.1 cation transporter [Sphingomonas oleivorans]